jgi:hypothetical protein
LTTITILVYSNKSIQIPDTIIETDGLENRVDVPKLEVNLFDIEGFEFGENVGTNAFFEARFEEKFLGKVMVAGAVSLGKVTAKFNRGSGEAGDGGDVPFLEWCSVAGRRAGRAGWPEEVDFYLATGSGFMSSCFLGRSGREWLVGEAGNKDNHL